MWEVRIVAYGRWGRSRACFPSAGVLVLPSHPLHFTRSLNAVVPPRGMCLFTFSSSSSMAERGELVDGVWLRGTASRDRNASPSTPIPLSLLSQPPYTHTHTLSLHPSLSRHSTHPIIDRVRSRVFCSGPACPLPLYLPPVGHPGM